MRGRARGWALMVAVVGWGCAADDPPSGAVESNGTGSSGPQDPDENYCDAVQSWDRASVEAEDEVFDLINEARASGVRCDGSSSSPFPAFRPSGQLQCAARVHSKDMFDRGFFDHVDPDGQDVSDRVMRAGYTFVEVGESIANEDSTPGELVASWLGNTEDCANLTWRNYAEIGVGYYTEPGGGHLWTLTFGRTD